MDNTQKDYTALLKMILGELESIRKLVYSTTAKHQNYTDRSLRRWESVDPEKRKEFMKLIRSFRESDKEQAKLEEELGKVYNDEGKGPRNVDISHKSNPVTDYDFSKIKKVIADDDSGTVYPTK